MQAPSSVGKVDHLGQHPGHVALIDAALDKIPWHGQRLLHRPGQHVKLSDAVGRRIPDHSGRVVGRGWRAGTPGRREPGALFERQEAVATEAAPVLYAVEDARRDLFVVPELA